MSTYGGQIDGLFYLILWITGVIFIARRGGPHPVFLFRYRRREGRAARYTHGSNRLEVIWTIVPAVICVVLALMSRRSWAEIKQSIPQGAMNVEILAEQFAWNLRYPGADGKLNTADDVLSLNQLHIPVGRPVVVSLKLEGRHPLLLPARVPRQAGRRAGDDDPVWFEATRVGNWEIACAELCGLGHYRMRGSSRWRQPEDFEKWLADQAADGRERR